MAWDDTQTGSDSITYVEWNNMVTYVKTVIDSANVCDPTTLKVNGTTVTATAAELNALDGITSTCTELNILDGCTATAAELNILDGCTCTYSELNILDGCTASAVELNYNDITTLGTMQASKTVTANSDNEVGLGNTGKIKFKGTEPDDDHTGSGLIVETIDAGATITVGKLCYLASDGDWELTDADVETTTKGMLGISLEGSTNGNDMKTLLQGFFRDDSFAFIAGDTLYVSTTAGGITNTAPTTAGDFVRVIGYAITDDLIYFNPSSTYIEVQ